MAEDVIQASDSVQSPDCDVVVIGGGPAGSTVSALISDAGYRVHLYERDRFPRFHVGESLIPETYWVLQRLGMIDKLRKSPFVKKQSVQFFSANGQESAPFYFGEHKQHESSQTWQVVRSEFDTMMLANAQEHGVVAQQGVRVRDVLFAGDRVRGVRIQPANGPEREIRARVVVDASGQSALLMNRLKLRVWDPILNKGAIWSYFRGAVRGRGRDDGATLILQTGNRQGWFWFIPLHNDRASVGVVAPFDYLFKRSGTHEATFLEEVENCQAVGQRLAPSERIHDYLATRDFSYRASKVAGKGWVLIGDAFGFLDPLYSSGILLALRSGELAADVIVEGLEKDDLSADQLGKWGPVFNQGLDRMRRLVCEYYRGFNFGKFIRQYPHLRGAVADLLIGDLFDEKVDRLWQPMESLYPEGQEPPPDWDSEISPQDA